LLSITIEKALITTLNAHCYNITKTDAFYQKALLKSDILIPDEVFLVIVVKWLTSQKRTKIACIDLLFVIW